MTFNKLTVFVLALAAISLFSFLFLSPIPFFAEWLGLNPTIDTAVLMERQTFALALSAATGFATLIAAVWAAFAGTRAAMAARDQVSATRQATLEQQRPWIKVDLLFSSEPESTRDGGWEAGIGIHIENVGQTPALNVQTSVKTINFEMDLPPITREFAFENRQIVEQHGRPLMPGDQYVRPWGATIAPHPDYGVTPVIVGCVTYVSSLDNSVHQTAFCFVVDQDTPYGHHVAQMTSRFRDRKPIELATYWAAGFAD